MTEWQHEKMKKPPARLAGRRDRRGKRDEQKARFLKGGFEKQCSEDSGAIAAATPKAPHTRVGRHMPAAAHRKHEKSRHPQSIVSAPSDI